MEKWFYHLAKENNLPICFGYLDYETKTAGIGGPLFISENRDGYETNYLFIKQKLQKIQISF